MMKLNYLHNFEQLNGEEVLYIKTSMRNGVVTESLVFHGIFSSDKKFYDTSQEGFKEVIWSVVLKDTELSDEELFDIPEDAAINNGSAK